MWKRIFIVIVAVLYLVTTQAQMPDTARFHKYNIQREFSLLTGYSQGKYSFIDLGFAINKYGSNHHPFSFDYFISNEIRLGNKTIIGPKIGAWIAGGFAMGLNMIYYTDFDNHTLVLRPEMGIGIAKAKIVYGYNWQLTNRSFAGISKHLISINYCFRIRKL